MIKAKFGCLDDERKKVCLDEILSERESIIKSKPSGLDELVLKGCLVGYEKLVRYFSKTEVCSAYAIGTAMDPRLKLGLWEKDHWKQYGCSAAINVRAKWVDEYQHVEGTSGSLALGDDNDDDDEMAGLYAKFSADEQVSRVGNAPGDLLDDYLKTRHEKISSADEVKEVAFWRAHGEQGSKYYPLSLMARDYLAVPTTSVSVERVFSTADQLITKRRNRLLPENVRRMMLLKNWMEHLKQ